MKKETAIPYAFSAIFAIISIILTVSASNWKNKAQKLENEISSLKNKISELSTKKTEAKIITVQPSPQTPAEPTTTDRQEDRFTASREERTRERDPIAFAENMRNRFDELKQNDPERYNEITQRINEFTVRIDKEVKNRLEYLKNLAPDQNLITPEEKANYGKLLDILQHNSKTLSYLAENPDAEDASQLRMELFQSARETRELLNSTRKIAIRKVGAQNGLQGEKLKQFEEEITKAYEMTSMGLGGRFGRP